ncbi:MAG: HD domain-containing protein [Clostridia bacterium]|nr:HD domain-containing protein [Clostridia bacterium]
MDFQKLDRIAFRLMGKRKSHLEREVGAAYFHGKRTGKSAVELRKRLFPEEDGMDDILLCAGMFHDMCKGLEPHADNAAFLCRKVLAEELTEKEMDAVCQLIHNHDKRHPGTEVNTVWERLLQDADVLDHYGSQGIWMSNTYYAYCGQREMAALSEFYFKEWEPQCEMDRKKLNFDLSKQIFDEKIAFEGHVIRRMLKEAEGEYCL